MKKCIGFLNLMLIITLVLSACAQAEPEVLPTATLMAEKPTSQLAEELPSSAVSEEVLYLNLIWHQHQPLYYKDENDVYTRPWVRVHATKDYYDMAAILKQYPEVKLTFNLTPVLIKQLDDYSKNNATDLYWQYSLIPAEQLTNEQKEFILARFFDANWDHIIARFPAYQDLLNKRGGSLEAEIQKAMQSYSDQDFRDLQVWFNLAWFDPDFLAQEPLSTLVEKQKNFSEEDKNVIFQEALRVIREVVPVHKELQDKGQIEVITTPYSHPILPLIIDSSLAEVGNPSTDLPTKFSYPMDALVHLEKSVEIYEEKFGQAPKGLWPGEGSVAQVMVPFVLKTGYQWMATGEPVLAKSLGIDSFTRDAKETVNEADMLYRPYYVKNQSGEKLAVFFRDGNLADKIGFTYSGVSGGGAAKDLMTRLETIRSKLKDEGAEGPHIVTIVVDGENAWEHYDNDGKDFFHALYQALSESQTIKTITPSEYLALYPEQRELEDLFPGAWFSPNYDTWIGEAEENTAWEYLRRTREVLAKYDISKMRKASEEAIALAQDYMYLAEGSDWFWWYGSDQDSGQDSYFDEGFRALLKKVFESLSEPVPTFVNIPIIEMKPVAADKSVQGLGSPTIDEEIGQAEWDYAGDYQFEDGGVIDNIRFVLDDKNLYFLIDSPNLSEKNKIGFYIKSPRGARTGFPFTNSENDDAVMLGTAFNHLFEWRSGDLIYSNASEDGWEQAEASTAQSAFGKVLELSIPIEILGELETGDEIQFSVWEENSKTQYPAGGPGQIILPDLGNSTVVLEVIDPEGDDFGPGTYTYPTDSVFPSKAFDLKSFRVAEDENNLIFKIELYGPIPNPWGSPNNLAIQTIDIYIDTDPGTATGARALLPGRNLSLSEKDGWEYAIWLEGWTPQILSPDGETLQPKEISTADYKIIVDPAGRSVTIRVAKALFPTFTPELWGYAVMVMGQEGYPSSGVWRIRDVDAKSAQWRFGGAGNSTNHTRVIDLIWPDGVSPTQAEMLSDFTKSTLGSDQLTVDDYAIIELIIP